MSGRKRAAASCGVPQSKKRCVTVKTVEKWITESDKELNTSVWLKYEKADREYVTTLKCSMCIDFKDKLVGMRNYNPAFVDGSTNLRASSFKDHAATDMHARAMLLFKKQSSDVAEYAPIATALHTLFNSTDAKKWSNILSLVELLFCFPMTSGRLERIFSRLKAIKTERHTCLGEDRLDSLLRIAVDAPPLSRWDASGAVQRWWGDKKRRQVNNSRTPPKPKDRNLENDLDSSDGDVYTVTLEDWESWIA